jgi:DNA (cytosine-5)-methyltransferase 1
VAAYYNEFDPFVAAWLRNLVKAGHVAAGDVDERSITEVQPDDLRGYTQCHFFAGIGGWSYALRLAGWGDDRPVWTGSCPCQPFSSAAHSRKHGTSDARHLWPSWFRLISKRTPPVVFGEQVSQSDSWLDEVCSDLEREDYTVGASVLPAFVVGQDHARERIYFAGYTNRKSEPGGALDEEVARLQRDRGKPKGVVRKDGVSGRVAILRAFGNAIVPQVAAEFIGAFMECRP